jgi:hypothetical protein
MRRRKRAQAQAAMRAGEVPEKISTEPKMKGRGMCPVCGVKPNYYMHVKNCRG